MGYWLWLCWLRSWKLILMFWEVVRFFCKKCCFGWIYFLMYSMWRLLLCMVRNVGRWLFWVISLCFCFFVLMVSKYCLGCLGEYFNEMGIIWLFLFVEIIWVLVVVIWLLGLVISSLMVICWFVNFVSLIDVFMVKWFFVKIENWFVNLMIVILVVCFVLWGCLNVVGYSGIWSWLSLLMVLMILIWGLFVFCCLLVIMNMVVICWFWWFISFFWSDVFRFVCIVFGLVGSFGVFVLSFILWVWLLNE